MKELQFLALVTCLSHNSYCFALASGLTHPSKISPPMKSSGSAFLATAFDNCFLALARRPLRGNTKAADRATPAFTRRDPARRRIRKQRAHGKKCFYANDLVTCAGTNTAQASSLIRTTASGDKHVPATSSRKFQQISARRPHWCNWVEHLPTTSSRWVIGQTSGEFV